MNHYEYTIYIDGRAQILNEYFAEEIIGYLQEYQIAMFIHPNRDCVYDEAVVLENDQRFIKRIPYIQQADFYQEQGFPRHYGLMASGIIVRNMSLPNHPKIERDW